MKTLCIYHGNCVDGFGAAWVVRRRHPDAEFFPGVYQKSPPDVTDKHVILVDFSYKRPVVLEMAKTAALITIIDHHGTAIEDLKDIDVECEKIVTYFDIDHSGSMLAWKYYFPEEEPPQLLKHIEDRDLWRFKLHGTREINAALFSYPYDFEVWDELMSQTKMDVMFDDGRAIERKHHKDIAELLEVTTRPMEIGGHLVNVANLPYTMSSDAAHVLSKDTDKFAACYVDIPDGRYFSLRSRENGMDVSEIAKQYGGGGHLHASGFTVPWGHVLTLPPMLK